MDWLLTCLTLFYSRGFRYRILENGGMSQIPEGINSPFISCELLDALNVLFPLLPLMLEIARCCSACSHDSRFAVRIVSRNALVCGFENALWLLGKHFGCRNALGLWIDVCARKAVREA